MVRRPPRTTPTMSSTPAQNTDAYPDIAEEEWLTSEGVLRWPSTSSDDPPPAQIPTKEPRPCGPLVPPLKYFGRPSDSSHKNDAMCLLPPWAAQGGRWGCSVQPTYQHRHCRVRWREKGEGAARSGPPHGLGELNKLVNCLHDCRRRHGRRDLEVVSWGRTGAGLRRNWRHTGVKAGWYGSKTRAARIYSQHTRQQPTHIRRR
jgi:hypothetical protein